MANKVQISDAIDSTSSVIAASLKAVKQAYDKAIEVMNIANNALSVAQSSQTLATNVNNALSNVQNTANSALSTAQNAQNTANTANNKADIANNSVISAREVCTGCISWSSTRNYTLPGYGNWCVGYLEDVNGVPTWFGKNISGGTRVSNNSSAGFAVRIA